MICSTNAFTRHVSRSLLVAAGAGIVFARLAGLPGARLEVALTAAPAQGGPPTEISACGAINQPGAYILVVDLICAASGIQIRSSDVTLHLDGHTINGSGIGVGIGVGWGVPGGVAGVRVQGPGTIRNFAEDLKLQQATDSTFRGLTLTEARLSALTVQLSFVTGDLLPSARNGFYDNVIVGAAQHGVAINGGNDNVFRGNRAEGNRFDGFFAQDARGNDWRGNTAVSNGRDGFHLSTTAINNVVRGNTSEGNTRTDMRDDHGNCQANTWHGNTFNTSSPGCIR